MPALAAIALGSNLGDRRHALDEAIHSLSGIRGTSVLRASRFVDTQPIAPAPADTHAGRAGVSLGGPYLNAAALLRTSLDPRSLLHHLLDIERRLGRVRDPANRYAPRTIDLDLILYGDLIIDEPGLVVPHPRMHERRFVLEPLASIAPDWLVPGHNRTVAQLLELLDAPTRTNNQP